MVWSWSCTATITCIRRSGSRVRTPRYGGRRALGVGARARPLSAAAYNLFSIERDGAAWRVEQTVRSVDESLRVKELQKARLI